MRLLALETSTAYTSVALLETTPSSNRLYTKNHYSPMQHGQVVLPFIETLLQEAKCSLSMLDAIAYGSGPGSFTGTRIASCVAQGLGYAHHCRVIMISSMAAFAQTAYLKTGWTRLLVALDAHAGHIYWGHYHINTSGCAELAEPEQYCKPHQMVLTTAMTMGYGVGSGFQKYSESINHCLPSPLQAIDHDTTFPTAEAMLTLAMTKYNQKDWLTPTQAVPTYLDHSWGQTQHE